MPSDRTYDDTNTGAFSRNERKERDTHADVTGSLKIECPDCRAKFEMWLNAWKKERRSDGEPFYSVSLREKQPQGSGGGDRRDAKDARDSRDDGLGGRRDDRRDPPRDDRRDPPRDDRRDPPREARRDDPRDDRRAPPRDDRRDPPRDDRSRDSDRRRQAVDDEIPF